MDQQNLRLLVSSDLVAVHRAPGSDLLHPLRAEGLPAVAEIKHAQHDISCTSLRIYPHYLVLETLRAVAVAEVEVVFETGGLDQGDDRQEENHCDQFFRK